MARSTAIPPALSGASPLDWLRPRQLLRSRLLFLPPILIILFLVFHLRGESTHTQAVSGGGGAGGVGGGFAIDDEEMKGGAVTVGGGGDKAAGGDVGAGVGGEETGMESGEFDLTRLADKYELPAGAENVVLVIKTGGQVVWDKIPIHVPTTLTRAPNYLIYSDRADQVGKVIVRDVFTSMDPETIESNKDFAIYRTMKDLQANPQNLLAKEVMAAGGWNLDKYKFVPMTIDAWNRIPDKDWYFFVDDDTGIFWGSLMRYLDALDHTVPLYIGAQTLHKGELFAHGGSGYVVSRAAMKAAVARGTESEVIREFELVAHNSCCGDHVISRLFNATGTKLTWAGSKFLGKPWYERQISRTLWCEEVFTYHHLNAEEMQQMYQFDLAMEEKFRNGDFKKYPFRHKKHMANKDYILHNDVYEHFLYPVLRRLVPETKQWDNQSGDEVVMGEVEVADGAMVEATASAEACKLACVGKKKCLQWRYSPGKCDINTKGFVLGKAVTEREKKGPKKEMVSGWIMERIEEERNSGKCMLTE